MKWPKATPVLMTMMALFQVCGIVLAAEVPEMPPLKTFYTEVPIAHGGAPNCIIAVPPGDEYAQIGQRVAAAIKKASGADLAVQDASTMSPETLQNSNMILLGYFANNPLVEWLYDEYVLCLDAKWPGPGGYTIRTIHDPLGKGISFVFLGGCDVESVAKAVDDFISTLPEKGDISYPHTVKVVLPDGSLPYKPDPARIEKNVAEAKTKSFRAAASIMCSGAMDYYRTGNPEGLEIFKQLIPVLREHIIKLGTVKDARGAIHLVNVWDVVEEAPQFTDEDRRAATELLWQFANRFIYAGRTVEDSPTPAGNSWNARVAWDLGRYWMKYYELDVGGLWTWAHTRFKSQAKFWRSAEDCPSYGSATMFDIIYYVLSAHYYEYFESGRARKMADYGVAIINNLGASSGFGDISSLGKAHHWPQLFQVCAWKYQDGRYLSAYNTTHGLSVTSSDLLYNHYFQNEVEPATLEDTLGVQVVPLPDWVYEHRERALGTAPPVMNPVLDADPTPPQEKCFDKIAFRTSFDRNDQYLLLGGISHGYHAHPDGNSIITFTDNNGFCIFDNGYFVPDTIEHNTIVIFRDGLFEPVPRLTGLAALSDFDDIGMTQTYLRGYNGADWYRNIIWNKENYFLVIDEIEAQEPGTYGLQAVFRTFGDLDVSLDRVEAIHQGTAFDLVSASHAPLKITATMPPVSYRHAIVQTKAAELAKGDKRYFMNLLYSRETGEPWPYEIVPASASSVMVEGPDGYAIAGTGRTEPLVNMQVNAAVFYIEPDGFALTGGKSLKAGPTWFEASRPVNVQVKLGTQAAGSIEAQADCTVRLYAKGDDVKLDGKPVAAQRSATGLQFDLPAGKYALTYTPGDTTIDIGSWQAAYAALSGQHKEALAAMGVTDAAGKQMAAAWQVENSSTSAKPVYINERGEVVKNLARTGKPSHWAEASRGSLSSWRLTDGNSETYIYVPSRNPWAGDLPKDVGMYWSVPVQLGSLHIEYASNYPLPATDGQAIQAWDGEDWYNLDAEARVNPDNPNEWIFSFEPVASTRIRVLVTDCEGQPGFAELKVFAVPDAAPAKDFRTPLTTKELAVLDLDGDGKDEVIAIAGTSVKCINGDGQVLWEQQTEGVGLSVDAYDLDGDGHGEVVVGDDAHKLYCFDYQGKERWAILSPADSYTPTVEPKTGMVGVVRCADIDGDGDGEIVIGSHNWLDYAFDHEGKVLWKRVNVHKPTSIAFAPLGDGTLGSLVGSTYNSASFYGPGGEGLAGISVGYHGAAMSVVGADMDGNGLAELAVGSRVGGLHVKEYKSDKLWEKFMGAEVTQVAMADLTGDDKLELIAGSKNFYLLAADVEGNILWNCNVGEAILDLAVGDIDGDGKPEIVVGTEGGMVRAIDAAGNITSTFKVGDNVTAVALGDLNGDGTMQIVAGADDGYVYGDIK